MGTGSRLPVTLILGANGSIGQAVVDIEKQNSTVVGTYRNYDGVSKRLESEICLIQHDFLENSDTANIVSQAREHGTINKVYYLVGESWGIKWDQCTLTDFRKSIELCALPIASLIKELEPELVDLDNFMRWTQISGISTKITTGGPNKPTTGGAKLLAEFYFQSASAYYTHRKNLFNSVVLGYSERTKNQHIGYSNENANKEPLIGYQTTPQEVAKTLTWLNSDHNTYITGANLPVDGGTSIRTKEKWSEHE